MAIAFARARYLSRASGGNAVRSAAYNARASIEASRTGEVFHFRHRGMPEHHEVLLPEGAHPRFLDCATLWNAAEEAERRKDSQVAREIVLALPADRELTIEDRIELACTFVLKHFVTKGLAVQLDVHAPHQERGEGAFAGTGGDHTNWHAHLLITTRRIEGEGFSARKARDLEPSIRAIAGRPVVAEGEVWGEAWRMHQDRYFAEHGIELRVDAIAAIPGAHIGPVRMRKVDCPAMERAEALREANEVAARNPLQVLAALTRNNASFTERELDRYLARHLGGSDLVPDALAAQDIATAKAAVLGHPEVLALHDRETGEVAGRFSTVTVRDQERAALADGAAVATARHHQGVKSHHQDAALASRILRDDQRAAFEYAVSSGGLKLIEGRAGTGKSYTLVAVREAHELAGYRVVGLAPTNAVAQDLKSDGFREASTVHSALFQIKNGRLAFDRQMVLIVDEAAMLDSRVTGELLAEARRAGAKVVLAGDDRQLASIERGGLFAELRQAHGAVEITEVTRQRVNWQRQAARDLAEGRFDTAVAAFDQHGAITWAADQESARAALVARWTADTLADPKASHFVFAYTNADVTQLNVELRQVRRDRGELAGSDVRLDTKHGEADFAVGDRVQFTDTNKQLHIYNGNAGVITGMDADTGQVTARLDAAAGVPGREVTWSAAEFQGFRHGYAGTIYKGQGKTLDHTYLLHTAHWRAAASYVALTRQRESARVFVSTETAADARQLARQMGRGEVRAASVAWATAEELTPDLRTTAQETPKAVEIVPKASLQPVLPSKPDSSAETWVIPPYAHPAGRDSLGRGTSAREIAAVVSADAAVRRESEARQSYLQGAYRDPRAAGVALDELIKRQGWTSAAARVAADASQLGELRGRSGLFAGGQARAERTTAMQAASAIGPNLTRTGEAEGRAEQAYRAAVAGQRAADATSIPRLSSGAMAAVAVLAAAPDSRSRGEAWRTLQGNEAVADELRTFGTAVVLRFGAEGVRAMLGAGNENGVFTVASVAAGQQAELDQVAGIMRVLKAAERAAVALTQQEANTQRQGQRKGSGL